MQTRGSVEQVLSLAADFSIECEDAYRFLKRLPDKCVDFVFGSPPYAGKSVRYANLQHRSPNKVEDWIDWMYLITKECVRVCRGDVIWIANGFVKEDQYNPACEGLIWKCFKAGILCERPCVWHKNSPPSRKTWFGNDWEFVLCFKGQQERPYWNWEAVATPPKFASGGHFRQRDAKGVRRRGSDYPTNKLARPRDVIRVTVGGGHMGWHRATENEAPYPEKLVEAFLPALAPPNGIVCDVFSGSGTTLAVSLKHGRRFIGCELRSDQVALSLQRASEVEASLTEVNRGKNQLHAGKNSGECVQAEATTVDV